MLFAPSTVTCHLLLFVDLIVVVVLMLLAIGRSHIVGVFLSRRLRHYWKNMGLLEPPDSVKGMTELKREDFTKHVQIPKIRILESEANQVIPLIKTFLLKMEQLKNVKVVKTENDNLCREVLLHPTPVTSWSSLPVEELTKYKVEPNDFYFEEIELTYNNWRADEIFKKVLPEPENAVSSFSRIGHIVHVNLKDILLPFKRLIGEVLLDKVPGCRTVVNKITTIDNTYRNFQMELLAGEEDYKVETRENKIFYEFDFSKVYWNPRLNTEHARIAQLLKTNDVLYDIFAGVGPFAVPAAIKKCFVYANDLNPESYHWLKHNLKRNKCTLQAKLFNKDGRDFIRDIIRPDLINRWRLLERRPSYHIHITMNLPAMAVEFLDAFRGLLEAHRDIINFNSNYLNYPIVHVYYFAKGSSLEQNKEMCLHAVQESLGLKLYNSLKGIYFVRNVGLYKDMFRISFVLNKKILTTQKAPDGIIEIDEEQEVLEQLKKQQQLQKEKEKNLEKQDENPPEPIANNNENGKADEDQPPQLQAPPPPPAPHNPNEIAQKRCTPLNEQAYEADEPSPKLAKTNDTF